MGPLRSPATSLYPLAEKIRENVPTRNNVQTAIGILAELGNTQLDTAFQAGLAKGALDILNAHIMSGDYNEADIAEAAERIQACEWFPGNARCYLSNCLQRFCAGEMSAGVLSAVLSASIFKDVLYALCDSIEP